MKVKKHFTGMLLPVKIKKIYLYLFTCSLFFPLNKALAGAAYPRTDTVSALSVGDHVPDLLIANVINYSRSTVRITDFRGKLLILDFWATWCSPCVSMIPKMEALQKEFSGKVQFLPVAYQPPAVVRGFLSKLPVHPNYPEVVNDVVLKRYFPHNALPHYVWIDQDGYVKAFTEFSAVTAENINRMLSIGHLDALQKTDVRLAYSVYDPLFPVAGPASVKPVTRSVLSGYIAGLNCGLYYNVGRAGDPVTQKRITARNLTIPQLYQLAYSDGKQNIGWNKTLLEVQEPALIRNQAFGMEYLDWLSRGNGYCYELVTDLSTDAAFALMRSELTNFFPAYSAAMEDRDVNCLALIRTSDDSLPRSKGGKPEAVFDGLSCKLTNCKLSVLTRRLDQQYLSQLKKPVVDESGYVGYVDLQFNARMIDLQAVNAALEGYHLKLVDRVNKVRMLVLRDRQAALPPQKP